MRKRWRERGFCASFRPMTLQEQFEHDLPKMEKVLRFRMRGLRGERKDEAMAEALAVCWKAYLRFEELGRDTTPLVNKIAEYAARGVLSDKHLKRDVMTVRHRRSMEAVDSDSPAEQAAANIDFNEWLDGLDERERIAALAFAEGRDNTEVGEMVGHGRGTGSNLRRSLRRSWDAYSR